MTPRRLQIEQLERRDLLAAFPWPEGVGFYADFFNHAGAGLTSREFGKADDYIGATVENLITSKVVLTRKTLVGSDDDLNGSLFFPDFQNRVAALYVEGGLGSSVPNREEAVQAAFTQFVTQGGSYFGSCRGAYLASYAWKDIKLGVGSDKGTQTIQLPEDHPIAVFMREHGGTDTASSLMFYGGPVFNRTQTSPDVVNVGKVISGRYTGSAAMIEMRLGDGLISIVPNHPEYKGYLSNGQPSSGLLYTAGWLSYVIAEGQVAPAIKGELTNGEPVAAVVGDEQYHRWHADIPDGVAQMTIATNAIADTELYVTFNGAAYLGGADYSGDTVTITAPATGTWEVSVRGTHETANGEPYTLSLEMVPGGPQLDELWTIISTWAADHNISPGTLTVWLWYIGIKYADGVATAEPPPATRADGESSRDSVFANWSPFETDATRG